MAKKYVVRLHYFGTGIPVDPTEYEFTSYKKALEFIEEENHTSGKVELLKRIETKLRIKKVWSSRMGWVDRRHEERYKYEPEDEYDEPFW